MNYLQQQLSPIRISLIFLFWVALMGVLMRSYNELQWLHPYKHLLHSHSHVAFQGWLYTIIMYLLTVEFISPEQQKKGMYSLQLGLTVLIVVGILFSFVLQGYALFSILFSTLFQFLSYWFIFRLFKDFPQTNDTQRNESLNWIKWGMVFNIISTFGPWSLAVISAKGLAQTEWYDSSIYFFLHFQYNGWFTFVALGLFTTIATKFLNAININDLKYARYAMIVATFFGYSQSLLHLSFSAYLILPSILGALGLLTFLLFFLKSVSIKDLFSSWKENYLIRLALLFLLTKTLMQLASTLPAFEDLAFRNRDMVMFYMHWTLIGWISLFFIGFLYQNNYFQNKYRFNLAAIFLLIGFLGSEALLLHAALFGRVAEFNLIISGFSLLILLGITVLIFLVRRK